MNPEDFRHARKRKGWTQKQAAARLRISQPYVALLESGQRVFPADLARRAVHILKLSPVALPLGEQPQQDGPHLARRLGALGYPGFAYLRGPKANPADVLLTALAQPDLEPRAVEALPWLLLQFSSIAQDWLLAQARLRNLSNRLGFVVTLARQIEERNSGTGSSTFLTLHSLEQQLRESRLDKEDTLCQSSLSPKEREWLRGNRSEAARYWHLLTDLRPEHLPYV